MRAYNYNANFEICVYVYKYMSKVQCQFSLHQYKF